ncbi:prolyl oligopeptidase family serine peptidase [Conexibacter sp. JD483]|uniref:S9 family peptidase n=1 Tax=unclassified Conexibacter TaxID=2627773 RepID=UPI002719C49F|nr:MULTISPECIES: prolyl oligopeptidase family serine peptidase [unclassified Conexibacter]MDO8187562.1 prolyl oligopeptidase family serine peptidase [Conexibacter sp. CPCC 205706]MDO8198928.1 prolyl oligopeptidase family serine peptidase [Conexibacter sp. CPCC 205762]MDR9370365.1 prolyl oligopeptidase family serine peptidase [Conexibacter sp. JD483]
MTVPAPDPSAWERRFTAPQLLTARPTADRTAAVVVTAEADGATARILDTATGELSEQLPFGAGYDALLTCDRAHVVQLADDGGTEVGHLLAHPVAGGEPVDLTPGRDPYVVRGLEQSAGGSLLVGALVDEDGHHLVAIEAQPWGAARTLATTQNELWYPRASADGTLVSADTTETQPGVRRAAVTVYDRDGAVVGVCDDLPAGPVRAIRFSRVAGDQRLLVNTERSGWARPAIWDPRSGDRVDFELPQLRGDAIPLDWDAARQTLLLLHVEDGVQRLLTLDEGSCEVTVARAGSGSYGEPDVASQNDWYSSSWLAADGTPHVFEQDWTAPPRLLALAQDGSASTLAESAPAPAGRALASTMISGSEETPVQLWWALPEGPPAGTVLSVHGGPNLVTVDHWDPSLQAWLDAGFAVAALNYHGSVTFGRDLREGFWGRAGDAEVADVAAALSFLREQGAADPASTFITGASYGGHLSLLSLGRLPQQFAGAFGEVAMADWRAAIGEMNPAIRVSWINFLTSPSRVTGEPLELEAAIARFSPISWVGDVQGRVWLSQGKRDTRTPPTQAQSYVDALRARGGDALIEWFDAGHEPVGFDGPLQAQRRMLELARAAIAGERWS